MPCESKASVPLGCELPAALAELGTTCFEPQTPLLPAPRVQVSNSKVGEVFVIIPWNTVARPCGSNVTPGPGSAVRLELSAGLEYSGDGAGTQAEEFELR